MIYISAGMPRSGSRTYYSQLFELMIATGLPSAGDLRQKFGSRLPPRSLERFHLRKLLRFDQLSGESGVIIPVHTHVAPSMSIRYFLSNGRAKATYMFRDPRDVIVSALERGKILREQGNVQRMFGIGPYKTFARLKTLSGAVRWIQMQQYPRWKRWRQIDNVLMARYEDNITDMRGTLQRLAEYFELSVTDMQINTIVDQMSKKGQDKSASLPNKGKPAGTMKSTVGGGALLNKGVIGRHRDVWSQIEQDMVNDRLGKIIEAMGYQV